MFKNIFRNFATKLSAGSSKNTKDSAGKRLGVKKLGGNPVFPNDILIRQRGWKYKSGLNTFMTRDHTIHSKIEGVVKFTKEYLQLENFKKKITTIHVVPFINTRRKPKGMHPYLYHPELYPELAKYNSEPTNYYLERKQEIKK